MVVNFKTQVKNLSLLVLLFFSTIFFFVGVSIPGQKSFLHLAFVISGVILGFIFYLRTFIHVIKTPTLNSGKRMFWIVVIVCVPMIGSVIYILLQYAFTKKQVPKTQT
jgi:hypothetical protein